jgi:hypothetical protein
MPDFLSFSLDKFIYPDAIFACIVQCTRLNKLIGEMKYGKKL